MKQDEKIIEACVGDVKRSLDRNRDGTISKEEFITNARFVTFPKAPKVQKPSPPKLKYETLQLYFNAWHGL